MAHEHIIGKLLYKIEMLFYFLDVLSNKFIIIFLLA